MARARIVVVRRCDTSARTAAPGVTPPAHAGGVRPEMPARTGGVRPETPVPGKRPENYGATSTRGVFRVCVRYHRWLLVHRDVARASLARASLAARQGRTARKGGRGMDSGPAIFTGTVFALFGGALLAWTGTRLRRREPVAHGVNPIASAALASVAGAGALALGVYCLTRL
jgi:hypothetical protein